MALLRPGTANDVSVVLRNDKWQLHTGSPANTTNTRLKEEPPPPARPLFITREKEMELIVHSFRSVLTLHLLPLASLKHRLDRRLD